MIISRNIDDSKWEIEYFSDYKHRSKPVECLCFSWPLIKWTDSPELDECLEIAKGLPAGMSVTINKDIPTVYEPTPVLSNAVIIALTQVFANDPRFPVDIKMKHGEDKYRIHFSKDGSCKMSHTYKQEEK